MSYQYGRIRLADTNYQSTLTAWQWIREPDIDQLNSIYKKYCRYRQFASVMPIFDSEYTDSRNDVIGYWDQGQLEAFSIVRRFDTANAQCIQFAWTYHRPRMRLGIESLKTECAIYRDLGFKYLYLDQAHEYKQQFQGFELLGPLE
jgi:hypothetical protein